MNGKTISRRGFLHLSAAFAAAVVAGCQPAAPTPTTVPPTAEPATGETVAPAPEPTAAPTEAPKPVNMQFWWGWTPDIHVKTINAVVAKFMEQNPNIKVETGQDGTGEKLTTAFAAGTPPDLVSVGSVIDYARTGVALVLDEYMANSAVANKDAYLPAAMTVASWKGQVYGVPSLEFGPGLAQEWNGQALNNKGLKAPDDLPKTWDEAWEQIQKYTEVDDNGNIKFLWMSPSYDTYTWWGDMYGIMAYDIENQKMQFDDPRWKEIFDWLVRYYAKYGRDKISAFKQSFSGWDAVAGCALCAGVQAGGLNGFWAPGELKQTAPNSSFVFWWAPTGPAMAGKKIQDITGFCVIIAKASKVPDAAWKLAEYLGTDEPNKTLFEGCGFLNFTKSFLAHPETAVDLNQWPALRFFIDSCNTADVVYTDPSPIDNFIWDAYPKALDSAIYGEKTTEKALADLQAACVDALDKALAE